MRSRKRFCEIEKEWVCMRNKDIVRKKEWVSKEEWMRKREGVRKRKRKWERNCKIFSEIEKELVSKIYKDIFSDIDK